MSNQCGLLLEVTDLQLKAYEAAGPVGSFVPHDDTFSIKSFSSLLHFSALGALLKCF